MPTKAYNKGFAAGERDRANGTPKTYSRMPNNELPEYSEGYYEGAFGTSVGQGYSAWANKGVSVGTSAGEIER